jgi:hypothetical protein
MTNDELFIKSLTDFRNQLDEELSENKRTDGDNEDCVEYYRLVIDSLDTLLPNIEGIDSLYEVDDDGEPIFSEEEFSFLISCLEDYSEVFVVDGRDEESLKRTEEEHSQLADIIFEFYDDEDDEDDEEFDEEDSD